MRYEDPSAPVSYFVNKQLVFICNYLSLVIIYWLVFLGYEQKWIWLDVKLSVLIPVVSNK